MKSILKVMCALVIPAVFGGGCASYQLTDQLPPNSPKGYAEFYAAPGQSLRYKIYQVVESKESFVGHASAWNEGECVRRRVACTPGANLFFVGGTGKEQVSVDVKEGMVTPVRIDFTELSRSTSYGNKSYATTIVGTLHVNVEKPQPLAQYDAQLAQNKAAASDSKESPPTPASLTKLVIKR